MAVARVMQSEPMYVWGNKEPEVELCEHPVLRVGKNKPWAKLVPVHDVPEWDLRRGDIVVHTDYSGLGGGAMSAVTAGGEVYVAPAPMGKKTNVGEVAAVWHGLDAALSRRKTPRRVILATDSQEAILDLLLRGDTDARLVEEARENLLSSGIDVELWWCRGHSGSQLNSCADAAARARGRGLLGELDGAKMGRVLERVQDRARNVRKRDIMRNCHFPVLQDPELVMV